MSSMPPTRAASVPGIHVLPNRSKTFVSFLASQGPCLSAVTYLTTHGRYRLMVQEGRPWPLRELCHHCDGECEEMLRVPSYIVDYFGLGVWSTFRLVSRDGNMKRIHLTLVDDAYFLHHGWREFRLQARVAPGDWMLFWVVDMRTVEFFLLDENHDEKLPPGGIAAIPLEPDARFTSYGRSQTASPIAESENSDAQTRRSPPQENQVTTEADSSPDPARTRPLSVLLDAVPLRCREPGPLDLVYRGGADTSLSGLQELKAIELGRTSTTGIPAYVCRMRNVTAAGAAMMFDKSFTRKHLISRLRTGGFYCAVYGSADKSPYGVKFTLAYDGRARLSSGWKSFARKAGLQGGELYAFQFNETGRNFSVVVSKL
ncbi:hypothetical protein ACP70R_049959 [Stipagrostis hirtigluma subsp. patula]